MAKTDRRVKRTQEALRRAMMELIIEKGFDATHISEIAERANVGRSTFYAHYADKEDLLQGSIGALGQFMQDSVDARMGEDPPAIHPALAFCRPMLEHADASRQLFAAMVGRRGGALFQDLIHDVWAQMVRKSWPEGSELEVQALIGAFGRVLAWWMVEDPGLIARQVEERFVAFAAPTLIKCTGSQI